MVGAAEETLQEVLARLHWRKTQPPKSPLSGGLVTQFPPDKGARGVRNDECWFLAQSLKPRFRQPYPQGTSAKVAVEVTCLHSPTK